MKKLFLFSLISMFGLVSLAQDSTLQQYTGKFIFPEGNPVTEIHVIIENGILTGTSAMGNSEFKKIQGDEFEIVAYGGVATYKRDKDGKINALRIQVQDLDMEGQKSEKDSFARIRAYKELTEFIRK